MELRSYKSASALVAAALIALGGIAQAQDTDAHPAAQTKKPNILLIVSDDTGWGDLGPYGGLHALPRHQGDRS